MNFPILSIFPGYIFDVFFFVTIITILFLFYIAYKRPKKSGENTKEEEIVEEVEGEIKGTGKFKKTFITHHFDDFFPLPRKFKLDVDPKPEDKYHQKLNYHYIIERLTRKLYFLFLMIIALTLVFTYTLYKTSLEEQITPDPKVMDKYEIMMKRIMTVEDDLEKAQIKRVKDLGLDAKVTNEIKEKILIQTIKYEDELIGEVNSRFFSIYYGRYILVRSLIALIIIGLLKYLITLYMRIRADRNDLIRKEEALSILFYIIDDNKYGHILKDKIPNFPLRTLFESPDSKGRRSKGEVSPQLLSVIEEMVDKQTKSIEAIEKLAENISYGVSQKKPYG